MRWWNNCVEEGLGKKASKKKILKHGGVFSGERRMEPGERLTQVGLAQGPSGFLGADGARLYFFDYLAQSCVDSSCHGSSAAFLAASLRAEYVVDDYRFCCW